jgi:hypothetical protein
MHPFLVLLFALSPAGAESTAGWGTFANAFPLNPCQDGWVACLSGDAAVNPSPLQDSTGLPVRSDMRVGWFDLAPTATFDPFGGLSDYSESPAVAVAPEAPTAQDEAPPSTHTRPVPPPEVRVERAEEPVVPREEVAPQEVALKERAKEKEKEKEKEAPRIEPAPPVVDIDDTPEEGVISILSKPRVAPKGCESLTKLEIPAMQGKLSGTQIECLEGRFSNAAKITDQDMVSRVLINNAYFKGDIAGWAKLVRRHLDEVDRSDPDMALRFARHLSRKGPRSAEATLHWLTVARDNKGLWVGDVHARRVNELHRIEAQTSAKAWAAAAEEYNSAPSEKTKAAADLWRNKAKTLSREWLEFARAAGQDTTVARQLCVSAAGTSEHCN